MGYLRKVAVITVVLGFLTQTAWTGDLRPDGILKALFRLDQVQIQIVKNRTGIQETLQMLENNIINIKERQSLRHRIGMYQERIKAYHADDVTEVSYLRNHWSGLTSSEKDRVNQAAADLQE